MKHLVILIDDDHGPMDYYVDALRVRGFDVQPMYTTDDALQWVEDPNSEPPSAIVLDLMLPPGKRLTLEETDGGLRTGVFIAKAILKRFPEVPLIALTNHNDPEVVAALPAGMAWKAKFEIAPFAFADFIQRTLET
jgi:CheY-like chemotaxis protein